MAKTFEVWTAAQADGTPNANGVLQGEFASYDEALPVAQKMAPLRSSILRREETQVLDAAGNVVGSGQDSTTTVWRANG